MSKGSKRRPAVISQDEIDRRWRKAFPSTAIRQLEDRCGPLPEDVLEEARQELAEETIRYMKIRGRFPPDEDLTPAQQLRVNREVDLRMDEEAV